MTGEHRDTGESGDTDHSGDTFDADGGLKGRLVDYLHEQRAALRA